MQSISVVIAPWCLTQTAIICIIYLYIGERETLMDKKKSMEKLIKSVTLFLSIRCGFKIYIAFVMGILSGIAIFGDIYEITENTAHSGEQVI